MRVTLIVALAVLLLGAPALAGTVTLHDNGDVVEADLGLRFNYGGYSIYDDFELTQDSTICGFSWSQFDESGVSYSSTILTLFSGLPTPSNHIATFSVAATRASNGLSLSTDKVESGEVDGFDYTVTGLSTTLSAGTYYLGIYSHVSGGATLIANTNGTSATSFGFYQDVHSSTTEPLFGLSASGPNQFTDANAAFAVQGTDVPLPPAAWMGLGLLGLLGLGRKLRKRRSL